MKVVSLVSLFIAGLLLVTVYADGEDGLTGCAECGKNMVNVGFGCECNQLCHAKEPRICPKIACRIGCQFCACLDGFCLPNENSTHCVKVQDCH